MDTGSNSKVKKTELNLEDLLSEAEQWLNNIDFLSEEIRFLKNVISNYLKNLDEELKERLEEVEKELYHLESEKQSLRTALVKHLASLNQAGDQPIKTTENPLVIDSRHQTIQYEYHLLNKLTREFKDHLYSITEDIYG